MTGRKPPFLFFLPEKKGSGTRQQPSGPRGGGRYLEPRFHRTYSGADQVGLASIVELGLCAGKVIQDPCSQFLRLDRMLRYNQGCEDRRQFKILSEER